jgi:hypothetical protein
MSLRCVHRHDVDEMRWIHSGKQKEKPSDTLIELCNFFSFFFLYRRASGECVFLFYGPGVLYTRGVGSFVLFYSFLTKKKKKRKGDGGRRKETIWMC